MDSLLAAIVRIDGDALVLHVGEKPYVISATGQVDLSSRSLTFEALSGMLVQLLPEDGRRALNQVGAVEHDMAATPAAPEERFTVVAARGGDDIWVEIRRHRKTLPEEEAALQAVEPAAAEPQLEAECEVEPAAAVPETRPTPNPAEAAESCASASPVTPAAVSETPVADVPAALLAPSLARRITPPAEHTYERSTPARPTPERMVTPEHAEAWCPTPERVTPPPQRLTPERATPPQRLTPDRVTPPQRLTPEGVTPPPPRRHTPQVPLPAGRLTPQHAAHRPTPERRTSDRPERFAPEHDTPECLTPLPAGLPPEATPEQFSLPEPLMAPPRTATPDPLAVGPDVPRRMTPLADAQQAVVLPLTRNSVRPDHTPARAMTSPRLAGLDRLLRLAAARGASTLYIVAQARPSIRVDGEISLLDGEPPLGAAEVESLILDLAPERSRQALRSGVGTEWICDVPDVGRVRCMSFRDHRGPGGIFRLIPARAISAEQLGLSREIQTLCAEPEGLVLVAGPRSSGKSTLISAFVDLINRTRSDHVITLESEIKFVQESRASLVSQREVRGDNEELLAVGRAALRENPDVLVIEDLRSPEVVALAIEAAESGRLVIGAITAHTAGAAIGRLLDMLPPERRAQAQMTLAEVLRGVVAQVLLRKSGGGRVAARELLLNTPSVANLIAEGKIQQLPLALESGRKYGMVPLNDALVAFVQSGAVDAREAYRKAHDRQAFLGLLRREGIDTSFVERLA